jgi:AraC family transcriptional regulator
MEPPVTLTSGTFFGSALAERRTPSFAFSELLGTCPEREVARHTHSDAHFIYVLRGRYITEAREAENVCGPSTLIFNPAGTTHRDRFQSSDGRFLAISIGTNTARLVERALPVASALRDTRLRGLLDDAVLELRHRDSASDLILEGLGLEACGLASRFRPGHRRTPPRWLVCARDHIRDRCASRLSMREVAVYAGVHPMHLARAFRKHFGASPGQYQRACRIDKVREMLMRSKLPLAELAQLAGFSDQSQLSRHFKRSTGFTPGEFRRFSNASH